MPYDTCPIKGFTLRQMMTDTYIKHLAMDLGAELRPVNGNNVEAFAPLATWFASDFTKRRQLNLQARKAAGKDKLLPMIGWTVAGHDWLTYVACDIETDGGSVVSIVGQLIRLSASTNSIYGIFKLLPSWKGQKSTREMSIGRGSEITLWNPLL